MHAGLRGLHSNLSSLSLPLNVECVPSCLPRLLQALEANFASLADAFKGSHVEVVKYQVRGAQHFHGQGMCTSAPSCALRCSCALR